MGSSAFQSPPNTPEAMDYCLEDGMSTARPIRRHSAASHTAVCPQVKRLRRSTSGVAALPYAIFVVFGGWMAMELAQGMLKAVSAQGTCSVVTVTTTIPGPILTVSIIGSTTITASLPSQSSTLSTLTRTSTFSSPGGFTMPSRSSPMSSSSLPVSPPIVPSSSSSWSLPTSTISSSSLLSPPPVSTWSAPTSTYSTISIPPPPPSNSIPPVIPPFPTNPSNSFSPSTSISSSGSSSWTSAPTSPVSGTVTPTTLITSPSPSSPAIPTSAPLNPVPSVPNPTLPSSSSDGGETRVISIGTTAISFVFPIPTLSIPTELPITASFWTGNYPPTGPVLTTLPPQTRTTPIIPPSLTGPIPVVSFGKRGSTASPTVLPEVVSIVKRQTAPNPQYCGEYGNFTLTWDDTASIPPINNTLLAPTVTNPYHHLFFAKGFVYIPTGFLPFPPISPPNVAMFLPVTGLVPNMPFAGSVLGGEIGAGGRMSVDAYWFHAYAAHFGCIQLGITRCLLQISGYQYDATRGDEVLVARMNVSLPRCIAFVNCRLTRVDFTPQFRNLSGIQFEMFSGGIGLPMAYIMDSLELGWYNNSCSAGILRIGHRK